MNLEDDQPIDDELLLDTPIDEAGEPVETPDDDDETIDLVIDGEDEIEETPLVKKMRDRLTDAHREIKELRNKATAPAKIDVGPEPKWGEGDGWEYDGDKFAAAHREWERTVERANSEQTKAREAVETRNKSFERVTAEHRARGVALKVPDFDDCEKAVSAVLGSELLGAALVMTGANSAKLTVAIGRNPALLAKLDDETDPLRKLAMIKDWEHKMTPRKTPPPAPMESKMARGSASLVGGGDGEKVLAKLEKEWEAKGGSRDKIIAHKRAMKKKAA